MPEYEEPGKPKGRPPTAFESFIHTLYKVVDAPVTLFKEGIVEPIRGKNEYYYYHRKYRRVPTIDQCDMEDEVCFYEANEQFKRDRQVDGEIINLLRQRRLQCEHFYGVDSYPTNCQKVKEDYLEAAGNYFGKYGDLGAAGNVKDAYMKQKHRMIWERRHGPIGSQVKTED